MKIRPAKGVVALKPTTLTSKKSFIEVVEKNVPEIATVIEIGKGTLPVPFKVGSTLAYRKYGEYKFWLEGKEILFVKFDDILGVII